MRESDEVDKVIKQWRRERSDLDLWPVEVLARVTRFAAIMSRSFDEVFARHGLRNGEFDVLAAIRRSGPPYVVTPSALSEQLMLSRAGMTNRLDRLDRAGLINRRLDPENRRSFLVTLTEKGMAIVDAAMSDHAANESALLSGLSERQQQQLDDAIHPAADGQGPGYLSGGTLPWAPTPRPNASRPPLPPSTPPASVSKRATACSSAPRT